MPSLGAVLLAAALTTGFGTTVPVHVASGTGPPAEGTVVGEFLVAAPSRRALDGGLVVTLRPLALGTLAVPLPGGPEPATVVVEPTLAPGSPAAPLIVPPAPGVPWVLPAATLVAAAAVALAVAVLRRRRPADPVADLEATLRPLALGSAWRDPGAADALARSCRAFLGRVTGAPCAAMTTRELSRLLASRLETAAARPFGLALVLADEARYTRVAAPADDAALLVREVLATASSLTASGGGAR